MSIKGFTIYLFLSAIISIVFLYSKIYILIALEIILLLIVYKRYGSKHLLAVIGVFLFFLFYRVNSKPMVKEEYVEIECKVKETNSKYMIVQEDNVNYLVYYIDDKEYSKNDLLVIGGYSQKIEKDLDADVFEFKDYLKKKRVFYEIDAYTITIKRQGFNLSKSIVSYLTNKLYDSSYSMTMMLLFNDKQVNKETYEQLIDISAVHLFVVSGFHISFFFSLINKIIKNKKVGLITALVICTFYVFLLDFSISSTRALLSLFISKVLSDYFNKLDYVSIPGLLLLIIEPLFVYNYSFIMSFLMVFVITFSSDFISKFPKFVQTLFISLICFITIIPVQLIMNYKINFISLITNIILSYVVVVIFVLCLLGLVLSFIHGNLFGIVYEQFNSIIDKISKIDSNVVFGSLNGYLVVLYYLLVICFLVCLEKKWNKRAMASFVSLFLFMFLLYNRHWFLFYQQVTFLNVYQGDCIIIQDSYNGKVMMIDTGGLTYYDVANKKIIPYLEYHGIRHIDVVVITHDDFDHCGALEELNKKIEIKEIIRDPYVENIDIGKLHFTNINKYFDDKSSKNDSSIVLYGNVCSYDFLFTGDISKEIELQIYEYVYELNVDVLKVAHHGSYTSTCDTFVEFINPKYAVISVGENNFYGHPSSEVLDTLKKYGVCIYRTDKDGTIKIKGKIFDKCFIETAK